MTMLSQPASIFAARCYASAAYAVIWCPSVHLGVFHNLCISVETSKHIFKIFHNRVATPFLFFLTKRHSNILMGTPLTVESNAGGVGTNWDYGWIAGYQLMTAAVCNPQLTVVGAVVYHSYSACLFTAQRLPCICEYAEEKKTEFICMQQ